MGGGTYTKEVVEALGVPAELGQVVHKAVPLLVGEEVHEVAGVHPCGRAGDQDPPSKERRRDSPQPSHLRLGGVQVTKETHVGA